jgi:hypothetical protein
VAVPGRGRWAGLDMRVSHPALHSLYHPEGCAHWLGKAWLHPSQVMPVFADTHFPQSHHPGEEDLPPAPGLGAM